MRFYTWLSGSFGSVDGSVEIEGDRIGFFRNSPAKSLGSYTADSVAYYWTQDESGRLFASIGFKDHKKIVFELREDMIPAVDAFIARKSWAEETSAPNTAVTPAAKKSRKTSSKLGATGKALIFLLVFAALCVGAVFFVRSSNNKKFSGLLAPDYRAPEDAVKILFYDEQHERFYNINSVELNTEKIVSADEVRYLARRTASGMVVTDLVAGKDVYGPIRDVYDSITINVLDSSTYYRILATTVRSDAKDAVYLVGEKKDGLYSTSYRDCPFDNQYMVNDFHSATHVGGVVSLTSSWTDVTEEYSDSPYGYNPFGSSYNPFGSSYTTVTFSFEELTVTITDPATGKVIAEHTFTQPHTTPDTISRSSSDGGRTWTVTTKTKKEIDRSEVQTWINNTWAKHIDHQVIS